MKPTAIDDRRARLARYTTWAKADVEDFEQALREQRTIDLERRDLPRQDGVCLRESESESGATTRPA
jgi:hypothetical protein